MRNSMKLKKKQIFSTGINYTKVTEIDRIFLKDKAVKPQASEGLDLVSGCIGHWNNAQFDCRILRETAGKIAHHDTDNSLMSQVEKG